MTWDSTRRYYYRSERRGGKPRRVYVGGGRLGELAARQDAIEREARAAAADRRRAQCAADRAADGEIDAQYRRLRTWTAALLTAAGWYQHKREWRRMGRKLLQSQETDGGQPQAPADLEALVKRVNGKNPSRADLDALRDILADPPAGASITALDGLVILDTIIDGYTDSAASRLVMRADADRMAHKLGRAAAPPFERPLIDHIVTCWVRLQLVERDHAANTAGSHSRESGAYWDRRLTAAQRRYLRALHLLAKLRHMGPLQVNIANQQVVMNGRNE